MAIDEILQKQIDATILSTSRSAKVVMIICIASIISFCYFWNTRLGSSQRQRYQTLLNAHEVMHPEDTLAAGKMHINAYSFNNNQISQYRKFLVERGIRTQKAFSDYEEIYRDIKKDLYKCSIPVLGISIDIDDLQIFTGLTFVIILAFLGTCLEREHRNLETTFETAVKKEALESTYLQLDMNQPLFFAPRIVVTVGRSYNLWTYITLQLYIFPFVIQALIFFTQIIRYRNITVFSGSTIGMYIILLAIIIYLSYRCVIKAINIQHTWKVFFQLLRPVA